MQDSIVNPLDENEEAAFQLVGEWMDDHDISVLVVFVDYIRGERHTTLSALRMEDLRFVDAPSWGMVTAWESLSPRWAIFTTQFRNSFRDVLQAAVDDGGLWQSVFDELVLVTGGK